MIHSSVTIVCCLAATLAVVFPTEESVEPNAPLQSGFRSPLDLTVDEKGETATVLLLGTRSIATVDLTAGKIKQDVLTNRRMPAPAGYSTHYDHLDEHLRKMLVEVCEPDPTDIAISRGGYASVAGASNERGTCWMPRRSMRIAVHQMPRTHVPASEIAQGWVFTNAFSLLEPGVEGETPSMFCLDEPTRAYADPSDVVIRSDGKVFFIAGGGADTVLAIDMDRLHKYLRSDNRTQKKFWKRAPYPFGGGGPDDTANLTASRHYVIAKLPTQSNPRRLGISGDGKTLVVANYLADSLTVIDAVKMKVLRNIALGNQKPDSVRRGEILFNSAKMTFHGQFSCAS